MFLVKTGQQHKTLYHLVLHDIKKKELSISDTWRFMITMGDYILHPDFHGH